jgi:hypothetical protein
MTTHGQHNAIDVNRKHVKKRKHNKIDPTFPNDVLKTIKVRDNYAKNNHKNITKNKKKNSLPIEFALPTIHMHFTLIINTNPQSKHINKNTHMKQKINHL